MISISTPSARPRGRAAISALALATSLIAAGAAQATAPLLDPSIYAPPVGWQTQPHGKLLNIAEVFNPSNSGAAANAVLSAFAGKANYTKTLRAWRISYTTTSPDANLQPTVPGTPLLATGIVIAPIDTAWPNTNRPVILFAPKTQGLGSNCAPSKALELGTEETSEVKRMVAALERGYIVAITDYDGYTNNSQAHQYLVGQSLGHSVLDMGLAVKQAIPTIDAYDPPDVNGNKRVKVSLSSPMAIWGYSEGGTAAAWAGQMLSTYAPTLQSSIKGVATGGMVADMKIAAKAMDWNAGSGLMLAGIWGFHVAYPKPYAQGGLYFEANNTFKMDLLGDNYAYKYTLNPPTTDTPESILHPDECVDQVGPHNAFKTIAWRNQGGYVITQFTTDTPSLHLNWDPVLQANQVGNIKIPVPTFFYHGSTATSLNADGSAKEGDIILPVTNFNGVYPRMCATGTKLWRKVYTSAFYLELNHENTSDRAFNDVLNWIGDRFSNTNNTGAYCN